VDTVEKVSERGGGTILTGEGHKIVIPEGVCSDHWSKTPEDCCREVGRKAAREDN
jgi:hypothetical protein